MDGTSFSPLRLNGCTGMAASEPLRLLLWCRGLVQGVGFRPLVYRLARELSLVGEVENVAGAVRVDLQGEPQQLQSFLRRLPRELPPQASLEPLQPDWQPARYPAPGGVRLGASGARDLGPGLVATALVADLAPCAACRAELTDPANRRYRYPFISCCACGPRYSIATAEPYSRNHTTLAPFALCRACQQEFDNPDDRRFHAETIGCPVCGPRLQLLGPHGSGDHDPIAAAAAVVAGGGILALQGVGGFQLLVDSRQGGAVRRLRRRKCRPHKPLALLVADLAWIEAEVRITPLERQLLTAPSAPIVLLRRRSPGGTAPGGVAQDVAMGSPCLGVMLPASPLHQLLAEVLGVPLVATSGNPTGEPLCCDPEEACHRLEGIADAFLVHNRAIARPLDDSLLRVVAGCPSLLRRARGYAPAALTLPRPWPQEHAALAFGGDLKAAPALAVAGCIWPVPYLGDLAGDRQQRQLEQGLRSLSQPLLAGLDVLVCDGHPGYVSHHLARQLAHQWQLPLLAVQHHLAHGLAVAAEHGLQGRLLVWAADGSGYGEATSHHLWGGELLLLENAALPALQPHRLACLRPLPLPGGEPAMREPCRVALGVLATLQQLEHPGAAACRKAFDASDRRLLLQALRAGFQSPQCSSLGRLFDAAASLLGVVQRQSFEGQAGLLLEGLASRWSGSAGPATVAMPLRMTEDLPLGWLDWQPLVMALLDGRQAGLETACQAAWLHRCLVQMLVNTAVQAAEQYGCRQVALAGGCFQNGLLLEGCSAGLRQAGLQVFWSQQVPCNDGGLALGQLWAALSSFPIKNAAASVSHVPGHTRRHFGDR